MYNTMQFLYTPLLLVLLFCIGSGKAIAQSETIWPADEWAVSTPQDEGIDASAIDAIIGDIAHGRYGLIDHFLVIRNGKIVVDYRVRQDYEAIAADYDTTNHQYNYDHPDWHPIIRGPICTPCSPLRKALLLQRWVLLWMRG